MAETNINLLHRPSALSPFQPWLLSLFLMSREASARTVRTVSLCRSRRQPQRQWGPNSHKGVYKGEGFSRARGAAGEEGAATAGLINL